MNHVNLLIMCFAVVNAIKHSVDFNRNITFPSVNADGMYIFVLKLRKIILFFDYVIHI